MVGFIGVCVGGWLADDFIVRKFSERSPLFVEYSQYVYPFCFLMLIFMWLESFGWSFRKSITTNTLRELIPRIFFTVLLILFSYHFLDTNSFVFLFSISYLLPVIILFIVLRKTGEFQFNSQISPVTYRLRGKLTSFGIFVFGAQFLNLLCRTIDTFLLASLGDRGLTDTAVFTIATYIVTLMEVPQRSMNAVSIPVLAESWKNKDLAGIKSIYSKSVANLLVIGLVMFSLIFLNIHNIAFYLGDKYSGITAVVLFMGLGKLIDLGTGANSQIITTSSFWKIDFFTNVVYSLVALPLNYFLISHFGLMGAAYSTLISLTFYNLLRFGFLYFKFGMQPYNRKNLIAVLVGVIATSLVYFIPRVENFYIDTAMRTALFIGLFVPGIYFLKVSNEINQEIDKYLRKLRVK
nr:oligosaccharide flippase family protein [Flavihumibacter stibioxidans]